MVSKGVVRTETQAAMKQWAARAALTLAGAGLLAAALLWTWRSWEAIPATFRVTLLVAAPLAALAATEAVARRERSRWFTTLLALCALAAFILNLTALGRWFNVAPSPVAFLVWFAFALLLAYRHGLPLLLLCGLGLLTPGVVGFTLPATSGMGVSEDLMFTWVVRPEFGAFLGLAIFAIPSVIPQRRCPEFRRVYRLAGGLEILLSLLWLAIKGHISLLPFGHHSVARLYAVVGLLSAAAAIWVGLRHGWGESVDLGWLGLVILPAAAAWWWWPNWMLWLALVVSFLTLQFARAWLAGYRRPPCYRLAFFLAVGLSAAAYIEGKHWYFYEIQPAHLALLAGLLLACVAGVWLGGRRRWPELADIAIAVFVVLYCDSYWGSLFAFYDWARLGLWTSAAALLLGLQVLRDRALREVPV